MHPYNKSKPGNAVFIIRVPILYRILYRSRAPFAPSISFERIRISMPGWQILKAENLVVQKNMWFDPGGEILAKL